MFFTKLTFLIGSLLIFVVMIPYTILDLSFSRCVRLLAKLNVILSLML